MCLKLQKLPLPAGSITDNFNCVVKNKIRNKTKLQDS